MSRVRRRRQWEGLPPQNGAVVLAPSGRRSDRRAGQMWKAVLAGSVSGVASTLCCHPFDTVRTRLQTEHASGIKPRYSGALHCFKETIALEGFRALYKGMAAPLAAQAVYKAVMFGAFRVANERLFPVGSATSGQPTTIAETVRAFKCGVFAGCVNSFIVCPVELVRNRLMIDHSQGGGQIGAVLREVGGIRALWRGQMSTLLRDGPGVGMWFGCFELSKRTLPGLLNIESDSVLNLIVSGSFGGVGFWLLALPFDTIKSNVQTQDRFAKRSIVGVARDLGIRKLYTGLGISLLRGIPGAGIVFLVQSKVMAYLQKL